MSKLSETECWYCSTVMDLIKTNRHHFCTDDCRKKYYKGVMKGLWKRGDMRVNTDDKPLIVKQLKGGKRLK